MVTTSKPHQTQWTGQFGVAHELTRRGYLVTLTFGNAPRTDLLCESPLGEIFGVQVKSLSSKTYFLFQDKLLIPNSRLYIIFVHIPTSYDKSVEYFIFNNKQFLELYKEEEIRQKKMEIQRGKPYAPFAKGIIYHTVNKTEYKNAWNNLPE